MTFNPLEQKGIPIEDQFRSWRELNVEPVDPTGGDPYTRGVVDKVNDALS